MAIYYYNFDPLTTWSIKYINTDTGSLTQLTSSFAKLNINNISNFSGKIQSVRVYKKNISADTDYIFVGDFPVQPTELLLSESILNVPLGIFESSSQLNNWTSASLSGGDIQYQPAIYQNNSALFNSVNLLPYSASKASEDLRRFKYFPKSGSIEVPANHEYTITAKLLSKKDVGAPIQSASLGIYVSGSAINHDILDDQLGKKLMLVSSKDMTKNYGEIQTNFITDRNGFVSLNFVVFCGEWYISDISIKAAYDDGFNPDEITLYIPLSNIKRNEIANFKLEFLNIKNEVGSNRAETKLPVLLKNQPVYIELDDNILSGSLNLGRDLNSGISLVGTEAPYISSKGYQGKEFAINSGSGGFLTYSGSVLSETGQEYRGVGFELNAGYGTGSLDFRYDPISGSYLIITASIYALPGSNVGTGSGGGVTGSITAKSQSFTNESLWVFNHALQTKYVLIQAYDINDFQIIPSNIEIVDENTALLFFSSTESGVAVASFGGLIGNIEVYPTASYVYSASTAYLATTASYALTASYINKPEVIAFACSDEITPLTASNNLITFYMPYKLDVSNIKASLTSTGSNSCSLDIMLNNSNVFSSPLIISASSYTGSLVPVSQSFNEDSKISVDLKTTGDGLTGLKIYILGYK